MKTVTKVLVIWGCIAVVLVGLLVIFHLDLLPDASCRDVDSEAYFDPDDLAALNLPVWDLTNAIPLAPSDAVAIALAHVREKHTNATGWSFQEISLSHDSGPWMYRVICRGEGDHTRWEYVRVLLNGDVWPPKRPEQTEEGDS